MHLRYAVGINPAAGASLFSLVGALSELALFFSGIQVQTRRLEFAAAATLLLASIGAFWFRSIDAEVYTWSFFFVALSMYLALAFRARPTRARLLLLLSAIGTGLAHHRLVGLIFPSIVVWIAPEAWSLVRAHLRLIFWSITALLLPFAVYLYLPLRAFFGTEWEFARADTWSRFLNLLTGRGYLQEAVTIPTDVTSLLTGVSSVVSLVVAQLTPLGVGTAVVAIIALWFRADSKRLAAFLTVGVGSYLAFALIYPIRDIDAYLVPATMLLLWAISAAVTAWSNHRRLLPAFVTLVTLCRPYSRACKHILSPPELAATRVGVYF